MIVTVAVLPPTVTVIVAVPALIAVTVPSEPTVTTVSSLDLYVTVLSVALSGVITGASLLVFPTSIDTVSGVTVTPSTATVLGQLLPPEKRGMRMILHPLPHHQQPYNHQLVLEILRM